MRNLLTMSLISVLALSTTGCNAKSTTSDERKLLKVFQNPHSSNRKNPAIEAEYTTREASVEFVPIDLDSLPYNASNIRYEGHGWYTFLWKGGCYIASAQDSGRNDFELRFTAAHNKKVCDLSDTPYRPEKYDHIPTQY